MKLLVDANLSPRIATALRDHDHHAVHVSDVDLATAMDTEIVAYAEAEGSVVVTADTDFPMLLALRRSASPSIVLLRRVTELSPDEHVELLLANLPVSETTSRAARSCPSHPTTSEFAISPSADAACEYRALTRRRARAS